MVHVLIVTDTILVTEIVMRLLKRLGCMETLILAFSKTGKLTRICQNNQDLLHLLIPLSLIHIPELLVFNNWDCLSKTTIFKNNKICTFRPTGRIDLMCIYISRFMI